MIYLDSSAAMKLLVDEQWSAEFSAWLLGQPARPVSSALLAVDVRRACHRAAPHVLGQVPAVLAEIALIPLSDDVLSVAGGFDDPHLRSLDALHLASALALDRALESFVTYDRRLSAAASAAGLDVVSPGATGE